MLPLILSWKTAPSDTVSTILSVLTTDQKGAIAEAAITLAALRLGVRVARPVSDERYDLIFDVGGRLLRVQCKWASHNRDVIPVRCYSCRRTANGLLKRAYGRDEVNAFAVYCAGVERCYFLTFECVPASGAIQLRLNRARNNQQVGVHEARRYEFAATLGRQRGAIAQLGERLHGMQEVAGSSPAGSTL